MTNSGAPTGIPADDRVVAPPPDGRQSETALAIARGTGRLLTAHGLIPLAELTLPTGRRADLVGVAEKGEIWIIEIKSSIEDFRTDQKWPEYIPFCDRFFFAVGTDFPCDLIPAETGLIVADRYGGEQVRPAPLVKMAPAQRKAVMLRFARTGAARLHALYDPENAFETRNVRE